MELGLAPRTLSVWTRDYLRTTWREAAGLGAWEPILELALRVVGYASVEVRASPRRATLRISGPYTIN